MKTIRKMGDIRNLHDGAIKTAMEARAELCHYGDEDVLAEMEEEFNGTLGGDWYIFEDGDDPHNFVIDDESVVDLLSEEWNWCDEATLMDGCYFVFWGINNAGGPCLFVLDEPWVPVKMRAWLAELVAVSEV